MATGFGAGFDLTDLLNNIKKADAKITELMDKNNQASKSIITAFQQMNSQGILPYVQSLEKQVSIYKNISESITDISGKAIKGYGGMKTQIDAVVKSLEVVQNTLKSHDNYKKEAMAQYYSYASQQLIEHYQKEKRLREQNLEEERKSYAERQRMYDKLLSNGNIFDQRAAANAYLRTDGKAWNVSAEHTIKNAQQELQQRRQYVSEMTTLYKGMFDQIIASEELNIAQRKKIMADYYQYEANTRIANFQKNKEYGDKILQSEKAYYDQRKKMYESLFSIQHQISQETSAMLARVYSRTDGKEWNVDANKVISQNQKELSERRKYIIEQEKMYGQMFDTIANEEQRKKQESLKRQQQLEQDRYEQWLLSKKSEENEHARVEAAKTKATQEAIQKQNEAYAKQQKYKDDNQHVKDNAVKAKQAYEEQMRAYTQLFDTAIAREKKQQDEVRKYEQQRFQESLDKYRQMKKEQESVDKHYHDKRQREYEEMFRQIDELAKKESQAKDELAKKESQARRRRYSTTMATGDTTQHALNSFNRLMGDKGLFNLNNAQKVISQLEQAQAKVNLRTQEGKRAYARLGNAINAVRGRMSEYGAQTDALRNKHQGLMDISGQLARRLALVFSVSQITNYARKIIDVRRQFELQHRSLQILIQDQDKANDIWNQTVALALKSPFRVKELVTYTKQLAAYRIETEKLHDTTKMLADVSAGLGVDMNRLILAFGQIKAANFLRGTELRQLTEAGIPMLDELAKHFNDMNKTALTSADVFEMISKRMVTFKDVEAVFKRITSEGGVFYKMQEQQAETLHGMISNLGDSFDLMMNSIGQANDGVMKDTISSIKTIVDNWRVFAEILKQVAVLLASIKVAQFANAWMVASGSIASATIASEGMVLTCSKLRRTLVSLKTTMMGHPLLLIGTLVASGISALMAYNDAIDETNKRYDEASTKELRKRDNLLKINKEVEKNNDILKDSTKSEQELEKARKANENQLKLLKNDYPQINNYIKIQKDGTIDLTRAIEEQNNVLRANIALQQASKRSAFQEDLSTNYADVLEKWADFTIQFDKVNAKAYEMLAKIEHHKDKLSTEDYEAYKKLYEQMSQAKSVGWLSSLRKQAASLGLLEGVPREVNELFMSIQDDILTVRSYANDWLDALDDLYDNLDNGMSTFIVNIKRLYDEFGKNANSDKFKKQGGKFITDALKNLGITDERTLKEAQKYIQQEVSKALKIELDLDFNVDKGKGDGQLAAWAKRIKPEVEKFNAEIKKLHPELDASKLFPVPDADMTWEQYENLSKGIIEIAERTYQEGQKIFGKEDIEQTKALKLFIEQYKKLLNIEDKKKKDESDQTLNHFKQLVELLKQVKKEYDDVSKKRGTAEGKLQAFARKQIVFDEIMSNLPKEFSGKIKLTDFDVTTETGMIDFLLKMLRELPDTEQKARLALKKFIGELQFEESNELAEKTNQHIIDSIDKQIGQYEVALEIKEMGVPADFAKKVFGLDAGSLDITDIINDIRTKLADANAQGMTDLATGLENKLKQAENILIKRNRDELDRFVEYYKESMDKIKVIQDKGEMDLSLAKGFLDKGAINTEEYVAIVKTIVDRVNSEISNVKIDKFKQSELYIKVMGDVAAYTNEELKDMIRTLNEIIAQQGHVMKSQELREYEKAIKKIQEQIQKNDDNKLFRDENWSNIKEILALEEKITQEKEKQTKLEGDIKFEEQNLQSLKNTLANELAKPIEQQDNNLINATESSIVESTTKLTELKDSYNGISTSISEMGGEMSNLTNGLGSSLGVVDKIIKGIYQGINASIQIFNHVKELADSMGTDVDSGKWNRAQEIFKTIGDVNNEAMAGWESLKSGDIAGAIAHTVGSITKLWAGINRIFDTKHENRIIEAKKQVELLERQYRKLEDAINDAFTFDAMKNSYGQALDNLQKQKAQYMEMLDAERDKKNEDKEAIAEYEDKIYDLERSMKEMQEEKIEKFGGTTDYWSTAEDFTNAWLDAFKETGNGLKGLEENMDEFLRNVAIKQVIGQKVGQLTKDFADIINPRLEDGKIDDTEGVEIENARERFINALNQYMQGLMGSTLGDWLFDETNSTLSGLSQGIQGVTEETAQIIEAYLNSIRFMIADNNSMWKRYIDIQLSDTDETANPILSELKAHTTLITEIRNMFSSVIQNGKETPLGGQFLKVVMG